MGKFHKVLKSREGRLYKMLEELGNEETIEDISEKESQDEKESWLAKAIRRGEADAKIRKWIDEQEEEIFREKNGPSTLIQSDKNQSEDK